MNEPQVWTVIGVFTAIMLGGFTLSTTLLINSIRTAFGGLRGEMRSEVGGLRGEMRSEISGLRGEMNARFETIEVKLDHLDRDVTAISRKVFGVSND